MKKFFIQIIILLLAAFGALYFAFQGNIPGIKQVGSRSQVAQQIKVGETTLNIEVADTPGERSIGLGGRDSLPADSGMLFVFPESKKYQFWMKGMKFPLDLIFIKDGKIVDFIENASPPTENQDDSTLTIYEPTVPVDMLLEVNSGFSKTNNIKAGDQVFLIK